MEGGSQELQRAFWCLAPGVELSLSSIPENTLPLQHPLLFRLSQTLQRLLLFLPGVLSVVL